MNIYLFLAEGFEEIEAVAPMDIFRRASLEMVTVSVTGDLLVCGAHGICVKADKLFEDVAFEGEYLIYLPGGMPGTTNLDNHAGLKSLIASQVERGQQVAAICAAPSILGKMGYLQNKEAICYPGFEGLLKGATISEHKVVKSGNIFTAKGPGVAMSFALRLVEEIKGKQVADQVADALML